MKKAILTGMTILLMAASISQAAIYRSRGIGYLGGNDTYPLTQRQIMAREAAIMDAQKSLLAQITSFKLSADARVEDKVLSSEEISRSIEGVLRDARIESEKQLGKVAYEVTMIYGDKTEQKKPVKKQMAKLDLKARMPLEVHPGVYDNGLDLTPGAKNPAPLEPTRVPSKLQRLNRSFIQAPALEVQEVEVQEAEVSQDDDQIPGWLKLYESDPQAKAPQADQGLKDQVRDLKRRMKLRDETINALKKTLKK